MPPKVPNLRFKPKVDTRVKDEPADDDPDMMSLAARERLRQQQLERTSGSKPSAATASTVTASPAVATTAGPATRAATTSRTSSAGAQPQLHAAGGRSTAAALPAASRASPSAVMLDEVRTQLVLPKNTMDSILLSTCNGDEVAGASPFGSLIPPVGITPLNETDSSGMHRRASSTAALSLDPHTGTAFLDEWRRECEDAYRACLAFFGVQPNGMVAGPPNDSLICLQLPRAHGELAPQLDLSSLPPGKVGVLKVHRSGRCVLDIFGTSYDVSCQGGRGDVCEPLMAQVAVATVASQRGNGSVTPSCFELGSVRHKFVCTPSLDP